MSTTATPGLAVTEFTCIGCQTILAVPVPKGEIVNNPKFSMVVLPHEKPTTCPQCGKMFVVVIMSLDQEGLKLSVSELMPARKDPTTRSTIAVMPDKGELTEANIEEAWANASTNKKQ